MIKLLSFIVLTQVKSNIFM